MMFPYPSAEGLHIGNIYAFTGADVYGRYWRLRGKTVFEPIGFDAFGIHSENYALKVGTNPNDLIPRNVANFTRQLKRIGGMFDWNHTVDTTDARVLQVDAVDLPAAVSGRTRRTPRRRGQLVSVLQDGARQRAGHRRVCANAATSTVEQRRLPQWYFKISQYADRLLDNIEGPRLVRHHAEGAGELDRP